VALEARDRIPRARRLEAASGRQKRRDEPLIHANEADEECCDHCILHGPAAPVREAQTWVAPGKRASLFSRRSRRGGTRRKFSGRGREEVRRFACDLPADARPFGEHPFEALRTRALPSDDDDVDPIGEPILVEPKSFPAKALHAVANDRSAELLRHDEADPGWLPGRYVLPVTPGHVDRGSAP
jgi:hypothetical protein